MQRAFGVISILFMLHLSVAGSDLVCAKHGVAKAHPGNPSHSSGQHHSHQAKSGASQQQDDCETPATPDCCGAVTSCAPTFSPGAVIAVVEMSLVDIARPIGPATAPLLRVVAPETPPP